MAASLSNGKTFEQLIIECSEVWGHADQSGTVAAIPTDAAVLDKVKRVVNAGYRYFLEASDRWTFAAQPVEVLMYPEGNGPENIDADPGRYRAPSHVSGAPMFDWTFEGSNAPPGCRVKNVSVGYIQQLRTYRAGTGQPSMASISPIETGDGLGGTPKGYEFIFWPSPSSAYLLRTMVRVTAHTLVDLKERHVAGHEHDGAIIACCHYEWYKDDADDEATVQRYKIDRDEKLEKSKAIDQKKKPRNHGVMRDPSVDHVRVSRACGLGPVTFDGVAVE